VVVVLSFHSLGLAVHTAGEWASQLLAVNGSHLATWYIIIALELRHGAQ
jgi:hypothetical protein